jgi:purine-binding chemotaxis protein CheW
MLRIVRLSPITRVPHAPHFLEGVFNYRGQVVPVVDLHKRLALPGVEYGNQVRILIVELEAQPVGMLADAVIGISRLPDETIQPATGGVAQVEGAYLSGIAQQDGRFIALLSLDRMLG